MPTGEYLALTQVRRHLHNKNSNSSSLEDDLDGARSPHPPSEAVAQRTTLSQFSDAKQHLR